MSSEYTLGLMICLSLSICACNFLFLISSLITPHMQTITYPGISQLSHYPPIRQAREELEGTATRLNSALSTPFHAAPPSFQLLGPSVKFTLPFIPVFISNSCQGQQ